MRWLARVFASAFVRKLGYVAAGFLVAGFAHCANAHGTVSSTVGTVQVPADIWQNGGATYGTTMVAACNAWAASRQAADGRTRTVQSAVESSASGGGQCTLIRFLLPGVDCLANGSNCGSGQVQVADPFGAGCTGSGILRTWSGTNWVCARQQAMCPPNATDNGVAVCVCNIGFQPNAGGATQCVVLPAETCNAAASALNASDATLYAEQGAGISGVGACYGGCVIKGGIGGADASGRYISGPFSATGEKCNGTHPTDGNDGGTTPAPLLAGNCPGQVNGVDVPGGVPCSGGTTTPTPTETTGPSSTASSPAGTPAGTAGTSGTTTCKEGTCTTTTTTTTNNSNGTSTTSTSTQTQLQSDFCAKNPGSPQCGEGGGEEGDGCEDSATVGCMGPGTLEATPLQNTNVSLGITPSTGFGASNGTCPAPQTATLLGHTYSFSWQPFCDMATGIRPVVLALAWLSAVIGFVGLSRKGN